MSWIIVSSIKHVSRNGLLSIVFKPCAGSFTGKKCTDIKEVPGKLSSDNFVILYAEVMSETLFFFLFPSAAVSKKKKIKK